MPALALERVPAPVIGPENVEETPAVSIVPPPALTVTPRAVVMELVNDMGFDAVDAGGLDESWRQQPATPVYTADLDTAGVREALRKATPERKPEWRATPKSPGSFEVPA